MEGRARYQAWITPCCSNWAEASNHGGFLDAFDTHSDRAVTGVRRYLRSRIKTDLLDRRLRFNADVLLHQLSRMQCAADQLLPNAQGVVVQAKYHPQCSPCHEQGWSCETIFNRSRLRPSMPAAYLDAKVSRLLFVIRPIIPHPAKAIRLPEDERCPTPT